MGQLVAVHGAGSWSSSFFAAVAEARDRAGGLSSEEVVFLVRVRERERERPTIRMQTAMAWHLRKT